MINAILDGRWLKLPPSDVTTPRLPGQTRYWIEYSARTKADVLRGYRAFGKMPIETGYKCPLLTKLERWQ